MGELRILGIITLLIGAAVGAIGFLLANGEAGILFQAAIGWLITLIGSVVAVLGGWLILMGSER